MAKSNTKTGPKEKAETKEAPDHGALLADFTAQLAATIDNVELVEKSNTGGSYTAVKANGRNVGYFTVRRNGIAVQVRGNGTVKVADAKAIGPTVKKLAAVPAKPRKAAKLADSKPEPVEALPTKVSDPDEYDRAEAALDYTPRLHAEVLDVLSAAVTPNSVVVKIDGKKVKPDPKPSAKKKAKK